MASMVAYLSEIIPGILGFLAGVLVGLYLVGGGGVALALAALAVVATVCSPFLVRPVEEASERRKEDLRVKAENRERYERHALDLNSHAFAPMIAVSLQSPLANAPIYGNLDRPGGTGLQVRLANSQAAPVEGLPNWQLASEHLLANSRLKQCWENGLAKARTYYELREPTFRATKSRLAQLVRADYGPEMLVTDNMGGNPPWCDVAGLAWFIIGRRGPLNRREFFNPGPSGASNLPRMISTGNGYFLSARDATEGDVARFQRLFDTVWADPDLSAQARATAVAETSALDAASELSEQVRVYSNRILVSHTFEGDCEVCRAWVPR